ncbi:TolC family protein [Sulfurospirillum diekertiae]|uniref:Outer membrane efflux protein BepC n=1 Tax=Sulfurospirillum diekertiae TaxID=1854492 RepID=A0A1Y0HQB6_9BACT|nr:TolC family protein [Sulfurospirillum diekertiae]ARU49383.1 Outer membrane efflux protein BepC [Sulfurospirillum diekertiae]ASC94192.1 Outer membrane efflux protein BepC [Sulfurospirillum diekertiae]
MRLRFIGYMVFGIMSVLGAEEFDPLNTNALIPSQQAKLASCATVDMRKTLGLSDVVMSALCNNPQTKIAWQTSLYQAAQVGVSRSAYLPTLSATGSILRAESSETQTGNQENVGVTLSYLLYDFGKRDATYDNAKSLLDVALFSENDTIQTVFLSAIQAYYALFGSNASLEASREAERSALESLNAAKTRYTVGTATPADTLQAQTAYSQAMLNRIQAEGNVKSAQGSLASVLGLLPDTTLQLQTPKLDIPSEVFESNIRALMEEAQRLRPDLMAAGAKIKAAEANIKAAKADNMPTFSLSATSGHTNTVFDTAQRTSSIGLYVSIPIFTGFNTKYKIQAAQQQLKINEAEYDKLSQSANLEVYQTYQTLISETQATRTSSDLVASAQASYDLALGRYKAGVGTILDLLSAQSALASAKQQHIQSLYNWYITKASLAKAMGSLDFSTIKGQP